MDMVSANVCYAGQCVNVTCTQEAFEAEVSKIVARYAKRMMEKIAGGEWYDPMLGIQVMNVQVWQIQV